MTKRRNRIDAGASKVLARFYADVHFNAWQDFATPMPEGMPNAGINSRLVSQLVTLESAVAPEKREVPAVVCGDIVHKRGVITPEVGWAVATWLTHLRTIHDHVYIFPGNHDYPLKAGAAWMHAVTPFIPLSLDGVTVVDFPQSIELANDTTLHIVPWMADIEDWREAVSEEAAQASEKPLGHSILATHIAVNGGVMANGHAYTGRGARISDLHGNVFDQVLLGDFHKRQQLSDNVHYIGSPMQHHWGDSGDTDKGYAEVILERGELQVRFTNLDSPQFIETGDLKEAEYLREKGHYVRLVSEDINDLSAAQAVGIATVREVAPPPESRIQLKPGSTAKDVLGAYFEQGHYRGSLDPSELHKLAASILDDTVQEDERQQGAMELLRVKAVNFLSYGSLDVPLAGQGVVLLDGVNEDDPDADSNGAGKSALIEAVVAGLYGKTLRNIPVGEWVKRGESGGYVQVTLLTPRGELVITRNRNHPDEPNGVSVTLEGERIDSTSRDFQNSLDEIIGMDMSTFIQVVIFGQEVEKVFAEESDSARKELLEQLCGGEKFDAPYAHTKSLADSIALQVQEAAAKVEPLRRQISMLGQDIEGLEEMNSEWESQHKNRLAQVREQASAEEAELRRLKQACKELKGRKEIAEREMGNGGELMSAYEDLKRREEQLASKKWKLEAALDSCREKARDLMEAVQEEEQALQDPQNRPVCRSCGSALSTDKAIEALERKKEKLLVADEVLGETQINLESTKKELAEVQSQLAVAEAAQAQARELHSEIQAMASAISSQEREVNRMTRSVEGLRSRVLDIESEENRFGDMAAEKKKQVEGVVAELQRTETALEQSQEVLPYIKECAMLFGNQGLRTFLFDSLAPAITREANRALAILSGGSITVLVKTERRGRSEKIVLEVDNQRGALSFGGNSGGQKRKVNLALCWAISKLAQGRVNVQFIDEAFDSLDTTAGIRVCDLLEARREETGTIIVTSHRSEFREAFPNVWTVRRSGGSSVLERP